uniref:hypothetical protein n=1 Tax=Helicobacter pylori TaxID=210 RepID=UPI001ABAD2B8
DLKNANALDYYFFVFVCITIFSLKILDQKDFCADFFLVSPVFRSHFSNFSTFLSFGLKSDQLLIAKDRSLSLILQRLMMRSKISKTC